MTKMRCRVAILAGGKGTRLKVRINNLPKPMAPLLGRPVLQHLIELCKRNGFVEIALLVHYEHQTIRDYFGDGSRFGVNLIYCMETEPRGTAGALRDALDHMAERFLVLYGDTYADVNLRRFFDAFSDQENDATVLLHPNDHPQDSDLVSVDEIGKIIAVHPYPRPEGTALGNLVNAALYAFRRDGLEQVIPTHGSHDLAKHTFPTMIAAGKTLRAYVTPEYIKDMGTPERLDKVERDVALGLPEMLSDRAARKAVFLDRDGTINNEVHHLSRPDQLNLLPGAGGAIRRLNRAGVLAICVTNQPVIARGEIDTVGMKKIHARLDLLLGEHHAYLDRLYLCPHHPDHGFPGEVAELKIACSCRKPKTGMIDTAVRDLNISRSDSWMIGDSTADICAGRDAGLRTILVRTGHAGMDQKYEVTPDYVVPDLTSAVDWILEGHSKSHRAILPVMKKALDARLILIGGPARAGKSSMAQVLCEALQAHGRRCSVLPLDGWLHSKAERPEGHGVLSRYDLSSARVFIEALLNAQNSHTVRLPRYNRANGEIEAGGWLSFGQEDTLIVEGVPALMDAGLTARADLRLFVDVDDDIRKARLEKDYQWRGGSMEVAQRNLLAREGDEVPAVRETRLRADFQI